MTLKASVRVVFRIPQPDSSKTTIFFPRSHSIISSVLIYHPNEFYYFKSASGIRAHRYPTKSNMSRSL